MHHHMEAKPDHGRFRRPAQIAGRTAAVRTREAAAAYSVGGADALRTVVTVRTRQRSLYAHAAKLAL